MFEEELLELLKEFYETEKFEFTENTKDCISEVLIYKKRDMKRCRSLAWTSRHVVKFDGKRFNGDKQLVINKLEENKYRDDDIEW